MQNSDDLDNYERNTQETIEITTLLQEGINEYTPEQENPGIPINVPTEDEQFYVDINNIVQPTFNLLKQSVGNWDNRDSSTFTKKIPNARQIKALERIAESMITVDPEQCPIEFLWEYNCAVYATARAWKAKNSQLKTTQTSRNKDYKPKWQLNIEKEMQQTRKEISQLTEEIKRLKTNGKLTKKLRRN